ncbi:MAG: AMP nucleosidase [Rhodospirillaceae bacterium]|nr:AMP nucleosidase [Rhodospirillaceae bacterium]
MEGTPPLGSHGAARDLIPFTDAEAALRRIREIYDTARRRVHERFARFLEGSYRGDPPLDACYPYVGLTVGASDLLSDFRPAYGSLPYPGTYGTTLTRPDLFADYYREQISLLLRHHNVPVYVGVSNRPIPLPFVVGTGDATLASVDQRALSAAFALPDLSRIDDAIANGTHVPRPGEPLPLALFTAERVDLALQRLVHYTGTSPEHFQGFVLFTNYQRYVEEFTAYGLHQVREGDQYLAFVEPGDVVTPNPRLTDAAPSGTPPRPLPQMPAYHLVRPDRLGVTLVNIGIGPSNAKTITDHLAVLRPHCWLMIGHCGGLRRSQKLGDYVLAHAYIREDHVLDQDLPPWVPVPPIAEVQVALQEAVARVTGLYGRDLKTRLRTGTVASTDNRNWELRFGELYRRFSQSRAIAIDMESAAIAANGFRLRVPYGTLLCVSDKPMHGEIKLSGMANAFYRERIRQHLLIALEAVDILRAAGLDQLHSRKLRSFDEPGFR